eukprot:g9768.t1
MACVPLVMPSKFDEQSRYYILMPTAGQIPLDRVLRPDAAAAAVEDAYDPCGGVGCRLEASRQGGSPEPGHRRPPWLFCV